DLMRRFGAEVAEGADGRSFHVRTGRYRGRQLRIEGDASSASYFFALAAMLGGRIAVDGVSADSRQGDLAFLGLLARMGCRVERSASSVEVDAAGPLQAIDADMVDMPDMVPTMAVTALRAHGVTTIRNVANLRMKESDRLAALAAELARLGASVRL